MLEVLDESIKQLLIQKTPLNVSEVDISFDVPNREWSGSISKPTINVYLHDIRENLELRQNDWSFERTGDGNTIKTKQGARMDLSYLITAWTTNIEDEHRLLWYILATLMRYPYLPSDVLLGTLRSQPYPMITKVAQPDGVLRNAADVWTALDNQLKPVLTYVVTASLDSHYSSVAPEVRTKFIRIAPPDTDTASQMALNNGHYTPGANGLALAGLERMTELVQIGGHVWDAVDKARPVRAEVVLLEQGLNVRTNEQGSFTFFGLVQRPKYTLLVVAPGYITARQEITIPSASYDVSLQPEVEENST